MLGTFYADEKFLSTPSARRATAGTSARRPSAPISIHALREEGDLLPARSMPAGWIFLSTPSARRATDKGPRMIYAFDISIHALREEGDLMSTAFWPTTPISIHALREEGDRRARRAR